MSGDKELPPQSELLVFIAYRRTPNDGSTEEGDDIAEWLNQRLVGEEVNLTPTQSAIVSTYYDKHAPLIHDWTQKWKGDLRTARAMILVCSPGTAKRREGTDWLYEEISWWIKKRKTAPLLVLAGVDEVGWIPSVVARRWPRAQRSVWLKSESAEGQEALLRKIRQGLVLSERGINYEELNRLRARNLWLGILTATAFILGLIAVSYAHYAKVQADLAGMESDKARKQTNLAIARQLAAESRAVLPTSTDAQITATLLAVESLRRAPLLENRESLRLSAARLVQQVASVSHRGAVTTVDYSSDGNWIATGSADYTARLLEAATGRELWRAVHGGAVNRVAVSRDGLWVATASDDGKARIMDRKSGRRVWQVSHREPVASVAFSADSKLVATAGFDGMAFVINVRTGQTVASVSHQGRVLDVVFSPKGHRIATASADGTVAVKDIDTDEERPRFDCGELVNSLAFSPDCKFLVASSSNKNIYLVDADTGKAVWNLKFDAVPNPVAYSPNGNFVAVGDFDNNVWVLDSLTGKEVSRSAPDEMLARINSLRFSPDSRLIASGSSDKTARVMSVVTGKELTRVVTGDEVRAVQFSPDGKWLATGSNDTVMRVTESTNNSSLILSDDVWLEARALSSDGHLLATYHENDDGVVIQVLDLLTGQIVSRLRLDALVGAIAISPSKEWWAFSTKDRVGLIEVGGRGLRRFLHTTGIAVALGFDAQGNTFAYQCSGEHICGIDIARRKEPWRPVNVRNLSAASLNSNGTLLAIGTEEGKVGIVQCANGADVSHFKHDGRINALAFGPNRMGWVVIGSKDGSARVMETATGNELKRLTHYGAVLAVAASPDGKLIATGSDDGMARVMEVATGSELARYEMSGAVTAVSFMNNSRLVVASNGSKKIGENKTVEVRQISLDRDELIADACSRLPRNLNRQEWERYLPGQKCGSTCPTLPDLCNAKN